MSLVASLPWRMFYSWFRRVMQSKKRGLSLEEKRNQMLQIFYESQDFFLLRELEKLGPKKGVISQTVKDVVQSLVDDDLAWKDKIGTSVYFWSLPSQAGNQLRQTQKKLEAALETVKKRRVELLKEKENMQKGREDSSDRDAALAQLRDLEEQSKPLQEELARYAESDPATHEAMQRATVVAREAANRWTDNIFSLQQWCNNTFPEAREKLEQAYLEIGITEDFDYLEN